MSIANASTKNIKIKPWFVGTTSTSLFQYDANQLATHSPIYHKLHYISPATLRYRASLLLRLEYIDII